MNTRLATKNLCSQDGQVWEPKKRYCSPKNSMAYYASGIALQTLVLDIGSAVSVTVDLRDFSSSCNCSMITKMSINRVIQWNICLARLMLSWSPGSTSTNGGELRAMYSACSIIEIIKSAIDGLGQYWARGNKSWGDIKSALSSDPWLNDSTCITQCSIPSKAGKFLESNSDEGYWYVLDVERKTEGKRNQALWSR
jgi:hypothetical protein